MVLSVTLKVRIQPRFLTLAQLSCGTLGDFFIMYPTAGTDPASLEWEQKQNEEAKTSPAMGFTFDSSKLNTQYTAVKKCNQSVSAWSAVR